MKHLMKMPTLTVGLALLASAVAQAQQPTTRIRGEIVRQRRHADGPSPQRRHREDRDASQRADCRGAQASSWTDIKPGTFIGTAAKTDAKGKLTAQEVVVFPEAVRGTGEGHYAWDLGPHSSMTNANVDAVVESTKGSDLHLSYKGGSNTVTVPPNVPIVTFIPASRPDLLVARRSSSSPRSIRQALLAQRVVVEKDGVVPPMYRTANPTSPPSPIRDIRGRQLRNHCDHRRRCRGQTRQPPGLWRLEAVRRSGETSDGQPPRRH